MCGEPEKKTRYLLGPFEEPDRPQQVMTLESALDDLRTWFAELAPGEEVRYRVIELTDAEFEALPEL